MLSFCLPVCSVARRLLRDSFLSVLFIRSVVNLVASSVEGNFGLLCLASSVCCWWVGSVLSVCLFVDGTFCRGHVASEASQDTHVGCLVRYNCGRPKSLPTLRTAMELYTV